MLIGSLFRKNNFEYDNTPYEERARICKVMTSKYPERIPVIIEGCTGLKKLPRNKFMTAQNTLVRDMLMNVRKRIDVDPSKAIFLFCGDTMLPMDVSFAEIYPKYKDKDGFLKIKYNEEVTFG